MKKSLSTKILALFMAVLMLVTAVPFVALAGPVEDRTQNTAASELKGSIDSYEVKVAQKKVYYNMAAGYEKYMAARKAYDAYVYGNANVDLAAAKTDLDTAIANMKDYSITDVKYEKVPTWTNDTNSKSAENSKNIVWTTNVNNTDQKFEIPRRAREQVQVYYGTTVLVYDGVNIPRFPAMMSAGTNIRWEIGGPKDISRVATIPADKVAYYASCGNATRNHQYPTNDNFNDPYFSVYNTTSNRSETMVWVGDLTDDFNYGKCFNNNGNVAWGNTVDRLNRNVGQNGGWHFYASSVVYNNSLKDFATGKYTNKTNISWTAEIHESYDAGISAYESDGTYSVAGTNTKSPIYVINIVPIKDAVENAVKAEFLQNIENYNETDVLTYMKAIDEATGFNLNTKLDGVTAGSIDYTVTTTIENSIDYIVESFNGVTVRPATDYSELKRETVKAWAITDFSPYTTSSVSTFNTAFKDAKAAFGTDQLYNGFKDTIIPGLTGLEKKANFTPVDTLHEFSADNYKYTVGSLQAIADAYNAATKYYKENADRENTPASEDYKIQAEADILNAILERVPTAFTSETEEITTALQAAIDNTDKYNVELLKDFQDKHLDECASKDPVNIAGTAVFGVDADQYIRVALNNMNEAQWPYTVTIDDETLKDDEGNDKIFHWGDSVTIDAKPYTLSVIAGETDQLITKYIDNMEELTVRGNMTLTSCDKEAGEKGVVKVVGTNGKVYYVDALEDGTVVKLDDLRVIAPSFYELTNFTFEGATVTEVTAEAGKTKVVKANFAAIAGEGKFGVTYKGETKDYKYDAYVEFEEKGALGFKTGNDELICYGPVCKLFVAEEIEIIPIMSEEEMPEKIYNSYVIKTPHVSGNKTTFVGSYLNTIDRDSVVTQGIIIDFLGGHPSELKLSDISNKDYVCGYTITSTDETTNQYGFILNGVLDRPTNYVSYVTYMVDGKEVTEYSAVRTVDFTALPSTIA